ncbi:hypothetical protein [uncultured Shewanella sp.]|uniref:hypothetical protein n=1 Tax=uncultured Shewanella sp. TaxID=173975 RepID=UPI00260F3852|nr:hypothetical protein [uncultured Shewanella sp.]
MTVSFTPQSFSWNDVDNLSSSVRNLASASNNHNIQLASQQQGDSIVLYARDTTKTGSLYPSQQGSLSKESATLAFKATQTAFTNLYAKAGLDQKPLDEFFSNITNQQSGKTSPLKEGDILRLCTMAKAAKANHLSQQPGIQSHAKASVQSANETQKTTPSLLNASRVLQTQHQFQELTIKDSYNSKDNISFTNSNLLRDGLNFCSMKASQWKADIKEFLAAYTPFITYKPEAIRNAKVDNIKHETVTSGQTISHEVIRSSFETLRDQDNVKSFSNPLTLDLVQSPDEPDNSPGASASAKQKAAVQKTLKELTPGQTAQFPFCKGGHWMLITAKHTGNQIEFTGLSTSSGYTKAMQNMMDAIKTLAPQSKEISLSTKVLQGQIQNKTGSSCGAYVFELATRIIRNGGNEVSAFNELTNEISGLSHTARRNYEVEEARMRLLFAYEQREVEDLIEFPKSRLEYAQKEFVAETKNLNLAENNEEKAITFWNNAKQALQRLEQEHELAVTTDQSSPVFAAKHSKAKVEVQLTKNNLDALHLETLKSREKVNSILEKISSWEDKLNIAQQNADIARATAQTKSLINLH